MDIRKIVFFNDKLRATQKEMQAAILNAKDVVTRRNLSILYKKWVEEQLWLLENNIPLMAQPTQPNKGDKE